jgi:nitrogen fixation NifU-like protein
MAYSNKVVDHFNNPRNMGSFKKDEEGVGTGMVGAPECGDVMKLQIKVQNDTIVDAKFKTFGCGSAIASSSLATEWLKGKTLIHCSVLAEDAIKAALADYKKKADEKPEVAKQEACSTAQE